MFKIIIYYNSDLSQQTFFESNDVLMILGLLTKDRSPHEYSELGKISNPMLGFDWAAISKLARGSLIKCFYDCMNVPITVVYEKTNNTWFKQPNTRHPSIDTLVHLCGQKKSVSLSDAESVLDIACGTGMAGAHAAKICGNTHNLSFADINVASLQTAKANYCNFVGKSDVGSVATTFFESNCFFGVNGKYDVITASAIPATPHPKKDRSLNPFFEGTGFMENLLRDAPIHMTDKGRLIVSHSSCGEIEFKDFELKYGAKVNRILYRKRVFFKAEFLSDPVQVDFLLERGGLEKTGSSIHPYSHEIIVKEISY